MTAAGLEYSPVAEIVPEALSPPGFPLTSQVTFVFVEFDTVAVNCRVVPF